MTVDLFGHTLNIGTLEIGKVVVLLLAVSLHESAHAYVAVWRGDPTPALLGRKTLNPIPHLHWLMSVLLPAFLIFANPGFVFGAGRPVPIVPGNMKVPDRDAALVAIAGPATNLLLTLVCTALLVAGLKTGVLENQTEGSMLHHAGNWLRFGIWINLLLMFFNLIPLPPLDGSRFLAYLLPTPMKRLWYRLDAVGFVLLIVLLVTGYLQLVMNETFKPTYDWWTSLYPDWV